MQAATSTNDRQGIRAELRAALVAGVLAGIGGLVTFLIYHHIWIVPIWFILPIGLFIAAVGGVAVGLAYCEIKPRLPAHPWASLAVMLIVGATLAPAILLSQLYPSVVNISTGTLADGVGMSELVLRFVVNLLVTATLVGGLVGWWIGRTVKAALTTALAGFIFALGPGHNIPFLGNTPGVLNGTLLLAAIICVSSLVLVASEARLAKRFG